MPIKSKQKTDIFSKTVSNVDMDKKKFLSQQCAYTLKFASKVGHSSKFKINFSPWSSHIFAILTSKMNSLTPKTPMSQFSGIRLLQKWNSSTIFKTREQNLPLVAKNLNCINLKTTRGTRKKNFIHYQFLTSLA